MEIASMQKNYDQILLLEIVETWRPSDLPEYRGFRCAYCQKYKNEAWVHWLNSANYLTPVHLCNETCEKEFKDGTILVDQSKRAEIDRATFGNAYQFPQETVKRFNEIVSTWSGVEEPKLKPFTCDECRKDLEIDPADGQRKGYHVWWKIPNGKTLVEFHFHRDCGHKLGIYSNEENKADTLTP